MAVQYACKNQLRRGLVLEKGTLNGIDYLEVLDEEAIPLGSPRQRTLVVHFLKSNPPLTVSNFLIQGGVRIQSVNCVWAPANSVPIPPANAAEQAYFAALPRPTRSSSSGPMWRGTSPRTRCSQ